MFIFINIEHKFAIITILFILCENYQNFVHISENFLSIWLLMFDKHSKSIRLTIDSLEISEKTVKIKDDIYPEN